MRGHGDAWTKLIAPLGATFERGRVDEMPGGAQALGYVFPDPAALIRSVDQYVVHEPRLIAILLTVGVRGCYSSLPTGIPCE